MDGVYADLILDSKETCSNCFRTVRVERIDPTREGFAGEFESHYERRRRSTTIEYAPHEYPPRSKGVFCQCGVEGSHERLWDPTDASDDRLKELIKHGLRSLEHRGVTLRWKKTVGYIIQAFRETNDIDRAFSRGIEKGIAITVASDPPSESQSQSQSPSKSPSASGGGSSQPHDSING